MPRDLNLEILVDDSEPVRKLRNIQHEADKTSKEVMRVKREAMQEFKNIAIASRYVASGVTQLFRALGLALDPFQQALVSTVYTTVEALTAVAAAEASTIVGLPAATKLLIATAVLQAATLPAIFQGMQEARESADRAVSFMESLRSFAEAFTIMS